MHPVNALRQMKHGVFVARKRTRFAYRHYKFATATALLGPLGVRLPFHYRDGRYAHGRESLAWLEDTPHVTGPHELPRRVFVVWSGDNDLSRARARNLAHIRSTIGVDVVLVSPSTVDDWVVPGHPLHPAYAHLSLVHRSDYLRGYLMHHHGGGYLDIKQPLHSWACSFERMNADPGAWVTSYPTTDADWVGKLRGRAGRDIVLRHRLMFGKGAFLMRSHTALTGAWLARMEEVLDGKQPELAQHPGGVFGDTDSYPLSWTDLLSRILDPLTLKYLEHVRYDDRLLLRFEDYR